MEEQTGGSSWLNCVTKRQVLFILSVLLTEIGCNYCIDIPGSLEVSMNKVYGLTSSQFSLFYSVYFLPGIFTDIIGGFLIDRWLGIKWTTFVFSLVTILGLGIFAAGGLMNMYWMMIMGRFLFGLGNETATGVCVSYCMFSWYNTVMNFVNIMNSCLSFVGTMAIYQSATRLFDCLSATTSLSSPENLGLVMLITSLVILPTVVAAMWMTSLGPESTDQETIPGIDRPISNDNDGVQLAYLLKFPPLFWTLCLFNVIRAAGGTFNQYTQGMFTEDFKMTINEASNAVAVSNIASIVVSIPVSLLVDRFGRNLIIVTIAAVLRFVPHLLLHFRLTPYFSMFLLGISDGLWGSAWLPMFGFAVNDPKLVGSCYGIQGSINGLAATVTPLIMGFVIDKYGFETGQLYYVFIAGGSTLCCILVWMLDRNNAGILAMSSRKRNQVLNSRLEETLNCEQPESFPGASLVSTITNSNPHSSNKLNNISSIYRVK